MQDQEQIAKLKEKQMVKLIFGHGHGRCGGSGRGGGHAAPRRGRRTAAGGRATGQDGLTKNLIGRFARFGSFWTLCDDFGFFQGFLTLWNHFCRFLGL